MDLRSHYPYWLMKNGLLKEYPSVRENLSTDVAIIGAGISGALLAWQLTQAGFSLIVLDKRHVGMGSTAASTSLLQYEIDTPLFRLKDLVGEEKAIRSYQLCKQSIHDLGNIARELPADVGFALRSSFQFASSTAHVKRIEAEYKARRAVGFEIELLNRKDVKKLFHFHKPGGLLSKDAGQVDAYKFTHALLEQAQLKGNKVFDHSTVTGIKHLKKGVELEVNKRHKIKARKLILACGYESHQYLPKKIADLHSTYAAISEPFAKQEFWYANSLIWETASPYLYLKVTDDHRIMMGGKDVPFYNPEKRDNLIPAKTRQLEKAFSALFPRLEFKTDFQWAGTFASTKDGLPYIGTIPQRPHTFLALGFGGNGITFSQVAAKLITDELVGRKNPDAHIFSFDR